MHGGEEAFARRIEDACLTGWPALRHVFYDGWLLRFSGGHTRRANSVTTLRPSTDNLAARIRFCESVYRQQSLPALFRVSRFAEPDLDLALDSAGYRPAEDATRVIHMDTAALQAAQAAADVVIESAPSEAWLAAQAKCGDLDAAAGLGDKAGPDEIGLPAMSRVRQICGRWAPPARSGEPAAVLRVVSHAGSHPCGIGWPELLFELLPDLLRQGGTLPSGRNGNLQIAAANN